MNLFVNPLAEVRLDIAIQIIRSLTRGEKNRLSAAGIVSLDDLMRAGRVPRVSSARIRELMEEAERIR